MARCRNFSLISYLDITKLKLVLEEHKLQIRYFAYILHDKDTTNGEGGELLPKEPHFHLILITYNATTVSAVRRWFGGWVDSQGKDINTLGQECKDIYNAYDYLYHRFEPDKYQYDSEDIVSNCREHFFGANSDFDNATEMLFDLVKGVSYRKMALKYGKDFIYHYNQLRTLAYDMIMEERCFGENADVSLRNIHIDK